MLPWIIWHGGWPGSPSRPLPCFWVYSQFLLQSNTPSPNLKSLHKEASFSQSCLRWIIWGSVGFWASRSSSSFFFCHECSCSFIDFLALNYIHVFCVGSLCLSLCMRDWGGYADSCQTDLWWGAGTQGEPQAYEVHDAFLLAIAAHILTPMHSRPPSISHSSYLKFLLFNLGSFSSLGEC